jgi:serine/threonine protein kinase
MRLTETVIAHLRGLSEWPDLTGTRYEIREVLGRGALGTVYLAVDRVLDREVALKVVSAPDSSYAELLAREARMLARLEHPGLVPVHDFGMLLDGRPYYVMKYVRGTRLDAFVRDRHDQASALRIFLKICDAVAFAHASGVVHGDLKPQNVMVGAFGEVFVVDWGSSTDEQDAQADVIALGAMLSFLVGYGQPALAAIAMNRYDCVAAIGDDVTTHLARARVSAPRRLVARFIRALTFGIRSGTVRGGERTHDRAEAGPADLARGRR